MTVSVDTFGHQINEIVKLHANFNKLIYEKYILFSILRLLFAFVYLKRYKNEMS